MQFKKEINNNEIIDVKKDHNVVRMSVTSHFKSFLCKDMMHLSKIINCTCKNNCDPFLLAYDPERTRKHLSDIMLLVSFNVNKTFNMLQEKYRDHW